VPGSGCLLAGELQLYRWREKSFADDLWFSPMKKFQNFFFRTPLVNVFIMGSEVYHDYYRWPMRDRRAFEEWLAKTEWGRMFQEYAKRGVLAPQATPR
jgi:hypothetical protein